jgi:hypothetical protein
MFVALSMVALAAFAAFAGRAEATGAEQIVDRWQNQPVDWELVDPCTGTDLHGTGTESGIARVTDLGANGHHVRVQANGTVDLYDVGGSFVGTWTYQVNFGDQFPPDAQGAVHFLAIGPLQYADGKASNILIQLHAVFGKGDTLKRRFEKGTCGG